MELLQADKGGGVKKTGGKGPGKIFLVALLVFISCLVYLKVTRQKDNVGFSSWFNPGFKLGVKPPPATRDSLVKSGKTGWFCDGGKAGLLDASGAVIRDFEVNTCGRMSVFEADILHQVMNRSAGGPHCICGISEDGQYALKCTYRVFGSAKTIKTAISPSDDSLIARETGLYCDSTIAMLDNAGGEVWKTANYVPDYGIWSSPGQNRVVYLSSSVSSRTGPCLKAESGYMAGCTETIVIHDVDGPGQVRIGPYSCVSDAQGIRNTEFSPDRRYLVAQVNRIIEEKNVRLWKGFLVLVDIKTGQFTEYPMEESWGIWKVSNEGLVLVSDGGAWRYINKTAE